jgi:hypothetical protein
VELRGVDGSFGTWWLLTANTTVPFGVVKPSSDSPLLSTSSASIYAPSSSLVGSTVVAASTSILPANGISTLGRLNWCGNGFLGSFNCFLDSRGSLSFDKAVNLLLQSLDGRCLTLDGVVLVANGFSGSLGQGSGSGGLSSSSGTARSSTATAASSSASSTADSTSSATSSATSSSCFQTS